MPGRLLLVVGLFCAPLLAGEVEAKKAIANGDYKQAIGEYQAAIKEAPPTDQAKLKIAMAKVYLQDQNLEKAFSLYLEAIDAMPTSPGHQPSPEEVTVYESALKVYLDPEDSSPADVAKNVKRQFATALAEHPDYYLLGFLFAAADANLGQYAQFFDLFARSYPHYPDHYLVYKTKAILQIKLFERARTPQEREVHQKKIEELLAKAIERNPNDKSLYKVIIGFSCDQDKPKIVTEYLNRIIASNMIVPRGDIPFFVQSAVEVKEFELAQHFLNKAREWYPVSRVLDTAQHYLDRKKQA